MALGWRTGQRFSKGIIAAMAHAGGARYKIIREAQGIADTASRLSLAMQDRGMNTRAAMASAAITARLAVVGIGRAGGDGPA